METNIFILPLDPDSKYVEDLQDPILLQALHKQIPYIYGYRNLEENKNLDVDVRLSTFTVIDIQPLGTMPYIKVRVHRDSLHYVQHSLNIGNKVRAVCLRTGPVLRFISHFLF